MALRKEELPRVRKHGKRVWSLLSRHKPFVLVDAAGDYFVDRGGWAHRNGQATVAARTLLVFGDSAGKGAR